MMNTMDFKPITRRTRSTSVAFAIGAVLAFGAAFPAAVQAQANPPRVQMADAIIAVVNQKVITRHELMQRARRVAESMQADGVGMPPAAEFHRQVLESMIMERAQLQRAEELGIRADDATVDRAIANIAMRNSITPEQLRQRLEQDGLDFANYREELRKEVMLQRLREREVENRLTVADSEIDNYLAAEKKAIQGAQELNVAHILVRIPENASAADIAQRKERAEKIVAELKAGADFARTAATYSDSPDALAGGDLGWRGAERLPQLFFDAVRTLKDGEVSQVVRSANGFHILKLSGRRAAETVDAISTASVQQTRARHILIKVNQVVTANEARRKLVDLKQRLDNGAATFEELAKSFSNDLSASRGGDLGWIYPGDTVPQFERAMDELQPGQVSEPIESPFGYHLIQVLERKEDSASDERQRRLVQQIILQRKSEEATNDWLRQLRDSTYVEYRFDEPFGN